MTRNLLNSIFLTLFLASACLVLLQTPVQAQPYWFKGTVSTPSGEPIKDARVWFVYIGAPNQGVTQDYTLTNGTFDDLPYMPWQYDIRLGIDKEGYEFDPVDYVIPKTAQTSEWITRNFTGIELDSWTSGQTREQHLLSGEFTYGYINIPPGAVEWTIVYNGMGNPVILPVFGSWTPIQESKAGGLFKDRGYKITQTEQTITINASSDPPIQSGKWYFGIQADEESTFTLTTRLSSADPDPAISGVVRDTGGNPVAGVTISGTNSADAVQTDDQGAYRMTVPFFWNGEVIASLNGGRFTPFDVLLNDVNADQGGIDFQGLKYPLTVNSLMGEVTGSGWHYDGSTADWSVTNFLPEGEGTRWIAMPDAGQVLMNAPQSIDVGWYRQHRLTTSVEPYGSGVVMPQTSWIFETMSAEVGAANHGDWTFTGFSGDLTGTENPRSLTMDTPKTVVAHFTTDNPPDPPGDINVPADYGTIQEAIDAAGTGDDIYVQPGIYNENIDFKGKDIVLRSYDPLDPVIVAATIIDGTATAKLPAVTFVGTESDACRLQGFTIANAVSYYGGIEGHGTLARIEYNVITNNRNFSDYRQSGSGNGGGVYDCDGIIAYNTITANTMHNAGGGLAYCDGSIHHNTITANAGGSIFIGAGLWLCSANIDSNIIAANIGPGILECADAIIGNCLIYDNQGPGISASNATIVNCSIVGNSNTSTYSSLRRGGGITASGGANVTNCIIWGNEADIGTSDPLWQHQVYYPGTLANCCIQDWTDTTGGCFADDPALTNLTMFDLRLTEGSPCIDTGVATVITHDYRSAPRPFDGDGAGSGATGDGSDFDIGAYEFATSDPLAAPAMADEPPVTSGIKNSLEWSEIAAAVAYRIECATEDAFVAPEKILTINTPALTATFTDLNDKTYYYRVCAIDQVGTWGQWSNVVASLQDATLPAFGLVSADPPVASPGMIVDIAFVASEALSADPTVSVNGHNAVFFQIEGMFYHYRYTVNKNDPKGSAVIRISGEDLAGLSGVSIITDALTRPPSTSVEDWLIYR